ncbi:hypothetical protein BgiMline_015847, partial [Biomphalaria glabrata]
LNSKGQGALPGCSPKVVTRELRLPRQTCVRIKFGESQMAGLKKKWVGGGRERSAWRIRVKAFPLPGPDSRTQ